MVSIVFVLLAVAQAWEVSIESTTETTVLVNVVNVFDRPITFSVWGSPLDKSSDVFRADLFAIADEFGRSPMYIGILERKVATLSSFMTLQPNQRVQTLLDLSKGYWFPSVGEYKVSLETMVRVRLGDVDDFPDLSTFEWQQMTSNVVTVQVSNVLAAPNWGFPAPTNGSLGGPSPRANCNSGTQVSQINTAGANAITATQQGYRYLPSTGCSSSLGGYITWFGSCDSNRYSRVRNVLNAVIGGLQANYPVDCAGSSCTSNTYAYVYPSDSTHTVYVCAYFWRVPSRNCVLDSQPGTLIHEMSHFNNVGSTGDVTYGVTNCKNLAQSNPGQAVNNADNYCFFTDSCY